MSNIEKCRVDEITKLHSEIAEYFKMSLDKAIRIGELLAEQKSAMKHGEFIPWLKENLPFAERTARNYMRLYRERDLLKTATVADLGQAYKLLSAGPKDPFIEAVSLTNERMCELELELAAATTSEECKRIIDETLLWQNLWAEIKIRAECKAGELLKQIREENDIAS